LANGKQRYKCHDCKRQFLGGSRLNAPELWDAYVYGKQTYAQLAIKYSCSVKTIQREIDSYKVTLSKPYSRSVIVLMDTTYWGRGFGVMLFKDSLSGHSLLKY
jgi:hypothetical protein